MLQYYAFMQSTLVNENRINRSFSNILADYYLVKMKMRTDSFIFNEYTIKVHSLKPKKNIKMYK